MPKHQITHYFLRSRAFYWLFSFYHPSQSVCPVSPFSKMYSKSAPSLCPTVNTAPPGHHHLWSGWLKKPPVLYTAAGVLLFKYRSNSLAPLLQSLQWLPMPPPYHDPHSPRRSTLLHACYLSDCACSTAPCTWPLPLQHSLCSLIS